MQALLAHAIDYSLLQSFPRLEIDAKFGGCCLWVSKRPGRGKGGGVAEVEALGKEKV